MYSTTVWISIEANGIVRFAPYRFVLLRSNPQGMPDLVLPNKAWIKEEQVKQLLSSAHLTMMQSEENSKADEEPPSFTWLR